MTSDPKPPAASGDRFDEIALKVWADLPGHRVLDIDLIAAALRAAATEAQLRVLRHWPAQDIDDQARIDARIRKIEKEGPL